MSQQQTVRITTTESSNSDACIINSGYLKTAPGLLKVLQFVNIPIFNPKKNLVVYCNENQNYLK